jgi:DNA-binding response OmpR family regulator
MKLAIYEGDAAEAASVVKVLRAAGHTCEVITSGAGQLLAKLCRETFHLLILDWGTPDDGGADVMVRVKRELRPAPPILMLSAPDQAENVVGRLNAASDDFIVKPVDPMVLRARVSALLRRAYPPASGVQSEVHGPFVFDAVHLTAQRGRTTIKLTAKEFTLALTLFRNLHRTLRRAYLMEAVWNQHPDLTTRTLDNHVSRLRRKLNLTPENGFKLAPIYSYGYRLERVGADEAA